MKKQILGLTIVISTVLLTALPGLTSTVKNVALRRIDSVKYQAVKLENSMDAMLSPEQGGISPMPPPPRWIPPVEQRINDKMPPAKIPKAPGYGNYTPVYFPPSAPWMTPSIEDKKQFINIPVYPIR